LRETLDSLTSLRVPADIAWELLVCDNNSPDDTEAVVDDFMDRLPMRRLFKPERGLDYARNRILAEARGE
jgi:glycosyltransferase involved in cell wall biosynthesis